MIALSFISWESQDAVFDL